MDETKSEQSFDIETPTENLGDVKLLEQHKTKILTTENINSSSNKSKQNKNELEPGQKARITKAINDFKKEANLLISEIENARVDITEKKKLSEDISQKIQEINTDAEKKLGIISEKCDKVLQLHSEIFDKENEENSLEEDIKFYEAEIIQTHQLVQEKKKDLDEYCVKIFGSKGEDGSLSGGLKQEIESGKSKLEDLYQQKEKEFGALFSKIEGLLPGATSIGLAKAFADQKNRYRIPNITWSIVFVITMIAMAFFGMFTLKDIADSGSLSLASVLSKILARSPIFVATIWLGYFASKQQSQNKRLEQEYVHKESSARSYEGFKKQIDDLEQAEENKVLSLQLLENLVSAIGYNPSITLDNGSHREEPPIMNKALSFVADLTGKGKKKDDSE